MHIDDNKLTQFIAAIERSTNIGIVTHSRPDGDAVGSSLAMSGYIESIHGAGKNVRILLENRYPETLAFMVPAEVAGRILVFDESMEEVKAFVGACDLLIFCDLNSPSRTGAMQSVFEGCTAEKILVDHHLDPDQKTFGLIFSEIEISSASELTYHIIEAACAKTGAVLPERCLNPLMTGITTDTNNFANSVYSSTLTAVSALLEKGADRDSILEHLYNEYPERRVRLMGKLLGQDLKITDKGVAYIILDAQTTAEYGILQGETEGFVNIPLSIDRVRMSFFLREDNGAFRVSIRSKKGVSANRMAREHFNGGGHEQAAGGKLPLGQDIRNAEDAAAYIIKASNEFFGNE